MSLFSKSLAILAVLPAAYVQAQDLQCMKFEDIYADGKELCENMWGDAFQVVDNYTEAYTMWFFDALNPNDATSQLMHPNGDTSICNLQYFHKTLPTPEGDGFTECHPWKEASCCTKEVANASNLLTSYGDEYRWDRCGALSPACERFFVQEACFYECSPHIGLYRRAGGHACDNSTGQCSNVYLPECDPDSAAYDQNTCTSEFTHSTWEVYKMPIRRDYCDAWLTACAKDMFCAADNGDYFSCARLQPETPTAAPASTEEKESSLEPGLIALVVIFAVLLVGVVIFLCVLYSREKAGKPLFKPLEEEGKGETKDKEGSSVALPQLPKSERV